MPTKPVQRPESARQRPERKEDRFVPADAAPDRETDTLAKAHLAALVDSSDDAIISKSLTGVVRSWNAAAERIFGYTAAEIVGQPITTIIPPELHDEEEGILRRLRRGERLDHFETVRVAKDGRRLDISLSVSPIRDATGAVVGAAKIARDVTEQRRGRELLAQAALVQSHFAALVASSDDAIISKSLEGIVRSWNAGAERIFGYSAAEMIGQPIITIIPPELHDEERQILERLRRGERIDHFETVRVTKDGRRLDISLSVSPIRDAAGVVAGAAKIARNITARREAERRVEAIAIDNARLYQSARDEIAERVRVEAALRRSDRIYRAIGDSIDYGIWVCDADGRNTYASESFLELVGMTQEQCANFGWKSILHPDDAERAIAALKDCVQRGGIWNIEHRIRGVDGRYHPVLARGVPVRDESGKVLCWAGINLDIADIKEAEDALREADRRKDEFLAILAHELRNPLAPMRYALAIARQPTRTPEQQRQAEEVMERQLRHMSRLLDDLLDVSRITHGTLEMRKSPIELTQAIATAIESARPLMDSRQHALTLDLPRHAMRVEADLVRLSQVFANLLINAAKYTDARGRLELRVWQEGESALVSVRDNGIGIAPEMLPRLFTLFAQERSALDRSEGGLGIGLALVKGVVALHGGTVQARSDGIRRGSEFIVSLPLCPPSDEVVDSEADAAPAAGSNLCIVVADDNRDSAETCAMLLQLHEHKVHTAHTGRGALALAERLRADVALLDIGMPEMNGYEVAQRIRASAWGRGMFLIAITGWGQADDKERALAAGFDHHLTKPIDPAQLEQLLRDATARRKLHLA